MLKNQGFAALDKEGKSRNTVSLKNRRKNDGRPRSVDAETVKALLGLPDRTTYADIRDFAMILLQLDTGIRPGEALQLLPCHVNLKTLKTARFLYTAQKRFFC